MKVTKWMFAGALAVLVLTGNSALAQGHGHGKGHAKHQDDDDDQGGYYKTGDRDYIRGWYDAHQSNLPPGLAKKDRLPPGLEKQLVRRGTLPPGLQKRRLPPPPPDCAHVLIAGHIVLLNRRTNVILDIVHFD